MIRFAKMPVSWILRSKPHKDGRRPKAEDARLAVNLPIHVHRALKARAAERGLTIRAYLLSLLSHEGIE